MITLILVFLSLGFYAQGDSTYYLKAKQAFKEKNCKDAIKYLTQDIKLNPKRSNSYYARALCYRFTNKYGKAITDLDIAVKLNPKYADAYNALGDSYRIKGDKKKAIRALNIAISIDSTIAAAYNNRALVYELENNSPKAEQDYLKAIKLEDDPLYYKNIGYLYFDRKDFQKAVDYATKAIEKNPNFKEGYILRSDAYAQLGDFDKAEMDKKKSKTLKEGKNLCSDCDDKKNSH